jgi:serine protease Do
LRLNWRSPVHVVESSGPAAAAGVEPGDELVSVDGLSVRQDLDFYIHLLRIRPNHRLVLELRRNGRPVKAEVHPEAIPTPDGARLLRELFGLHVEPLTPEQAKEIHPRLEGGLVITRVERFSPAEVAGFKRGHLIIQIDKYSPTDLDQVGLLLEQVKSGEKVLFRALEVRRYDIWILQGQLVAR